MAISLVNKWSVYVSISKRIALSVSIGGIASTTDPLKLDFSLIGILDVKLACDVADCTDGATSIISLSVCNSNPSTSWYLRFYDLGSSTTGCSIFALIDYWRILKLMLRLLELFPAKNEDLGVKLGTLATCCSTCADLFVSDPSATLTSVDSTKCFMNSLPRFLLITDWSSFFKKLFWSSDLSRNELLKLRSQLSTAMAFFLLYLNLMSFAKP